MRLKELTSRLNKSQKAKAWFYTLFTLIFVLTFSPILQSQDFYKPLNLALFSVALLAFIFYASLHIKGFITKKNVWKEFKFDLVKNESELKESDSVKRIKKILYIPIYLFLVLVVIFVIVMFVSIFISR